jgi:hypothetical protein
MERLTRKTDPGERDLNGVYDSGYNHAFGTDYAKKRGRPFNPNPAP